MDWLASGSWKKWLRRGLALLCAAGAVWCIRSQVAGFLVALPLGILTAVLALPELVRPFTWLIDVWLGTAPSAGSRPALDLRLARYYLEKERWEDAYAEYERILGYYPGVEEPYEEMFKLGARLGQSEAQIHRLYRRSLRRVRNREAQSRLLRAWEEAREMVRNGTGKGKI